ncbi:MAG: hypothetical protein JSV23_08780 [Promethearchaeota archaeon]|nr:MAG: hypothetical protein JSV23_08780 [Candidatus Lokiarchaeota archaeon]
MNVNLSFIPEIDYASLNDLWYNHKIEMLIITPNSSDFINATKPLMEWKNEKGVKTIILSNFSLYEGIDDAEKIRNMIKWYFENENIQWVLLAGDAQNDLIPIRNVFNPDVFRWGDGLHETIPGESYKPTDFYYADLTGTWDSDADGIWGEAPQDNDYYLDEISWIPDVYVGRFPANDAIELEAMVNKTLKYETKPEIGDWMNRMLLAGGISSYSVYGDPSGEYESVLTNYILENYASSVINSTHLIEEEGNLTRPNIITYFNMGYSTVLMAGHGVPTAYYRNPSTQGYNSLDANNSLNAGKPSIVYLDACSTSSYDYSDNNLGETLIKRLDGGAVGVIGGLRVTWYFEDDVNLEKLNRGNAKLFWKEFFINKKFQQGRALYDSKVAYINSDYYNRGEGATFYDFERKNILTYCLLGDPELDIYTNKPKLALNPFTENIYEGQLVSITIKDIDGKIIPYARVHLKTSDGVYHTSYADENGIANFRVPAKVNNYNVTITGHNLTPSYFNFTTLPDNNKPQLFRIDYTPQIPTTSDIITFNIEFHDNNSGIESIYFFLSKNNFTDYTYFRLSNDFEENDAFFTFNTERLLPGEYSYFIVARDYANNTNIIYNSTFKFTLPKPLIDYIIPVLVVMIIGVVGISVFVLYNGLQKYSRMLERK